MTQLGEKLLRSIQPNGPQKSWPQWWFSNSANSHHDLWAVAALQEFSSHSFSNTSKSIFLAHLSKCSFRKYTRCSKNLNIVHPGQAKVHPDQYLVLDYGQQLQDEDKLTVIVLEDSHCWSNPVHAIEQAGLCFTGWNAWSTTDKICFTLKCQESIVQILCVGRLSLHGPCDWVQ